LAHNDGDRLMRKEMRAMTATSSTERLTAPLTGVSEGRLVFARGAAHLTIRVDRSMDDLHRARFEGKVPEIRTEGGVVTIKYRPTLHPKHGEVTLSGRIPWSIDARYGMSDVVAALEDLEFRGWAVSAGVSRVQMRLPRPKGTVQIRIGAGASHLELTRPAGVPVSVNIGGGASKVLIDDFHGTGKIRWRTYGYDLAEDRYEIEIGAGASDVTVRM
jgi:hypothetical protein